MPLIFMSIVMITFLHEFYRNACRIIITDDIIIAERIFFSVLVIPLENITMIEKNLSRPDYYAIFYDNKLLHLIPSDFEPKFGEFEKVIDELEVRINKVKNQN